MLVQAGRHVGGLPEGLAAALLATLREPAADDDEILGDVAL